MVAAPRPEDDVEVRLVQRYNVEGCRHERVALALDPGAAGAELERLGPLFLATYPLVWCPECRREVPRLPA